MRSFTRNSPDPKTVRQGTTAGAEEQTMITHSRQLSVKWRLQVGHPHGACRIFRNQHSPWKGACDELPLGTNYPVGRGNKCLSQHC